MSKELIQAVDVTDIKMQVASMQEIMKHVLKQDVHYGKVPGCGDKPTLLKPGAEKLAMAFNLDLQTEVQVVETVETGHREYRCMTTVFLKGSDKRLGNGAGCATTQETKWRYRSENTGAEVPKEYWKTRDADLIGGSEFSTRKIDGTWLIFHRVEHDNPADCYNTCLKMAEKRSKVCAVLNVTAASDIFTQDIEEMSPVLGGGGTNMAKTADQRTKSKNPPVKKAQAKATGTLKIRTGVADVTQKETKGNHLYLIKGKEGQYTTFDEKLAALAKTAKENGLEVDIEHKGDDYNSIVTLDLVEE